MSTFSNVGGGPAAFVDSPRSRSAGQTGTLTYFFFLFLFLPFFPRLFFLILMLHVRFQLTFAMRPPPILCLASYTRMPQRVTTLRHLETLDKNSLERLYVSPQAGCVSFV